MRIKQKILSSLLVGTLLAPLFGQQVFAGTGAIYISPGSSSLQIGNSETVSIRISPGVAVDGVQATVSYNTSQLQLNSVDTSSSPFGTQLQKSSSGGTITVALGSLSGSISSDSLIANMNFTALANSGSATLTLSNYNASSSGSYTNPSAVNGSISLTAPPAGTPSPSGSSSSSSSKKTTTTSKTGSTTAAAAGAPAVATSETPAQLTSKLSSLSYTSATLDVTASRSLDLYALYGTDANTLTSKSSVTSSATKATIKIGDSSALVPGTTYYYQVIGEDSAGVQAKSSVEHFLTSGFTVKVTVLNSRNAPLANQTVSLHSRVQTATTDAKGVATFTNVAPGEHHIEYSSVGKSYSAVVYVDDSLPASGAVKSIAAQTAAVILPLTPSHHSVSTMSLFISVVISVFALIILGLAWLFWLAHGHKLKARIKPLTLLHSN